MTRPRTLLAMSPVSRGWLFGADGLDRLKAVAELDPAELVTDFADLRVEAALARVELLLTGWGCPPITTVELARMPHLQAIVHAGGSVKGFLTDECWDRGIVVSSAAGANALPVAEYTLAAILFAGKRVLEGAASYRHNRTASWGSFTPDGLGNFGGTVGVIGASRIGRRVLELLRPFDLRALVHDPYATRDQIRALGGEPAELDQLLAESNVVTVHAPHTEATHHLIDRRRLSLMRDGATLINTARGELVDTSALTRELLTGRLHAVLDVTDPEPLPADSPLFELPNVLLTPHIAGSMGNEVMRMARFAVDEVGRFGRGERFADEIRPESLAVSA